VTVTSPPRPARPSDPVQREELEALIEALFEEARQRQRRRRRRLAAVAILVTLVGAALFALVGWTAQTRTAASPLAARSSVATGAANSTIAFISEPGLGGGYCGTVYAMNPDGSGQRRLTNGGVPGCGQEGAPAWSPDGRRIALVALIPPNATGTTIQTAKIIVTRADGSGEQRLSAGAAPSWSPDGQSIAFVRGGLRVINADGSRERQLTHKLAVSHVFAPAWSPAGRAIAFVGQRDRGGDKMEIYVVNADGSGKRQLTHNTVRDSNPVWSPDGRRIAFENKWQIWVMNADGSGKRQLTRTGPHNFNPVWSSDGTMIAFERGTRQRDPCSGCPGSWGFGVYVMNADGSHQKRLAQAGSQPHWSPDGRQLAFVSQRDGDPDIYLMNAEGSNQRNLTRAAGNRESQPVWSPAQR
jgi:Tol biopolymer transport system component